MHMTCCLSLQAIPSVQSLVTNAGRSDYFLNSAQQVHSTTRLPTATGQPDLETRHTSRSAKSIQIQMCSLLDHLLYESL